MVRVPIDADPRRREMQEFLHYIGADSPPPVQRRGAAGVGIGPVTGGRSEVNPPARSRPPSSTMRSERPAPPRKI